MIDKTLEELLAKIPSLWSLELRFGGPTIEFHVAWESGRGINTVVYAGEGIDRAIAIRQAVLQAITAIEEKQK